MRRFCSYLLFAATACYPAETPDTVPEITIHLYAYSEMEPSARRHAQDDVEAVFLRAGIVIRWQNCRVAILKTAGTPPCGAGTYDVTLIVVAILPEYMSARIATSPQQFGRSVMGSAGGFATQAYVFLDRVVNFTAAERTPWTSLLGMVIAHEVGHLLLGSNSHSPAGIMRGKWSSDEVKKVLMGVLNFTPREAELMRAEVLRRMNVGN